MNVETTIAVLRDATVEQLVGIAADRGVDELVELCSRAAAQLGTLTPEQLVEVAEGGKAQAQALAVRTRLEGAREGERALRLLVLAAERELGRLLAAAEAGKRGKAKGERQALAEAVGIERHDVVRDLVALAELDDGEIQRIDEHLELLGRMPTRRNVVKAARQPSAKPGHQSAEWYTPPALLRAFERGHGIKHFDVDACSCLFAQAANVRARRWYSLVGRYEVGKGDKRREVEFLRPSDKRARAQALALGLTEQQVEAAIGSWGGPGGVEDGRLTQDLAGHVFGQPDYADPGPTAMSIVEGYNAGRGLIKAATILLNCATSSEAQQRLLQAASAALWIGKGEDHGRTRIAFVAPDGTPKAGNDRDQVAYYLGQDPQRWANALAGWGTVTIIGEALHAPPKRKKAPKRRGKQ